MHVFQLRTVLTNDALFVYQDVVNIEPFPQSFSRVLKKLIYCRECIFLVFANGESQCVGTC